MEDQRFSVVMNQTTFEESITRLSQIFDIKITLVGTENLSEHKFSLSLGKATFLEAAQESMLKAGLQSHALLLDSQNKLAQIWILRAGTTDSISRLEIENNIKTITPKGVEKSVPVESGNMRMMTPEEFSKLEPESEENYRSMTPEEFARLESEENFRGMTPGEFENLEPAESENLRMMTQEEFKRLESEENFRGMTPEEFAKLNKNE